MDNSLVPAEEVRQDEEKRVLILVVMDNSLVPLC